MSENDNSSSIEKQAMLQTVVLVIEDDEYIGEFIERALREATPYQALHFTDAVQALEAVKTLKPSLFVLDYQLPGINGLELFDRLHAMDELATIPALMMSANSVPRQELQKRHITFLRKPFDLNDLCSVIQKLLS